MVRLVQQEAVMGVQELAEISRYYGANPGYVIAGGGNTSFKDEGTLYIKGSGASLAHMEPAQFVRMDRSKLGAVWEKDYPEDPEKREAAVLSDMMAARCPGEEQKRPSVETLLHDLLPFAYVVHTHPSLVNGLTCSQEGENAALRIFPHSIWIPSINPGYILSRAVRDAARAYKEKNAEEAAVIFLQNHGVFVGAGTVEGIKSLYRGIMDTLEKVTKRKPDFSGSLSPDEAAGNLGNVLRGLAETGGGRWNVQFLYNREIAGLIESEESFKPVSRPFSPDHIVYAGSDPLFLPDTGAAEEAWKRHVEKTGRIPKIVACRKVGVFVLGDSEKAAAAASELFLDAVKISVYTESFGGHRFMREDQIDFINNWEVERYRSKVSG
ncbi:MAG: class II aldolase/adducin family protein [Treponema sp.]|jgi:rhamnose utilization protein RhaD (predicted bifunctional aldolase and dehydrogenase)|nr:class II aldolase/adducin family protein [Treponema sp.]